VASEIRATTDFNRLRKQSVNLFKTQTRSCWWTWDVRWGLAHICHVSTNTVSASDKIILEHVSVVNGLHVRERTGILQYKWQSQLWRNSASITCKYSEFGILRHTLYCTNIQSSKFTEFIWNTLHYKEGISSCWKVMRITFHKCTKPKVNLKVRVTSAWFRYAYMKSQTLILIKISC
jgi:hypothetical protein